MRAWRPLCPPIMGKYDDYGGIEEIEEHPCAELLESHFGVPLEKLAYHLTRGHVDDREALLSLKDVKYTWIHRKVWDLVLGRRASDSGRFDLGNHLLPDCDRRGQARATIRAA
jgi:hypothetical protein